MYVFTGKIKKIIRQPNTSYFIVNKNNFSLPVYQCVNEAAISILELINLNYTLDEIVQSLAKRFNELEVTVRERAVSFINEMIKYKILEIGTEGKLNNIPSFGSDKYFTPEYVMLELTSSCNLDCVHCYLGKKTNISVDFEMLKRVLSQLVELGINNIQLTGGEPLLYKKIKDVILFLVKHNVRVNISTGAYIEDDTYSEIISALSMLRNTQGHVQISIDGTEKNIIQ